MLIAIDRPQPADALASGAQVVDDGDIAAGDERYRTKFTTWFPELGVWPSVGYEALLADVHQFIIAVLT